ncbi:MAG: LysR family transcriptional regulator [Myxococcales bacterium]|nr:LysR family transcriptional regulator [Myxococcales bacterium]
MIDLSHVRHLLAVASAPTLQPAADALHRTQPALTRSIAHFEEELGAKRFDRRGRRLVLTELGERLAAPFSDGVSGWRLRGPTGSVGPSDPGAVARVALRSVVGKTDARRLARGAAPQHPHRKNSIGETPGLAPVEYAGRGGIRPAP